MGYAAILAAVTALASLAEGPASIAVRGKLEVRGGKPGVETGQGKFVFLDGDEPTSGVLRDARLLGADLEAQGRFTGPDRFQVDPIHMRALRVYREGKAKLVTYWCATCGIRTWTPGKCWCCQEETALDLLEPETLPQ